MITTIIMTFGQLQITFYPLNKRTRTKVQLRTTYKHEVLTTASNHVVFHVAQTIICNSYTLITIDLLCVFNYFQELKCMIMLRYYASNGSSWQNLPKNFHENPKCLSTFPKHHFPISYLMVHVFLHSIQDGCTCTLLSFQYCT